jgi:hypothetical protein
MVQFGTPELFNNDHILRFEQLEYANKRFEKIAIAKNNEVKDKVDKYTKLFIKGHGNDKELISCFRELLFNSRELLDSLLFYINKANKNNTSKSFLPFAKSLMNGNYDKYNLPILNFLKVNITYIFHIRKFRNEIKNKISNIEFLLVTNKIVARFELPITKDEIELIPFLDIKNRDQALARGSYYCQLTLNEYFPEIIQFWKTVFEIMKQTNIT